MPATPTAFLTRFPAFAAVATDTLASALAEGATRVDGTWTPGDYPLGVMLYAAHVLTLDGFGAGAEAAVGAAGAFGMQSFQAGSLTLSRRAGNASDGVLGETTYGRRFLALLKVNQPAVLVP